MTGIEKTENYLKKRIDNPLAKRLLKKSDTMNDNEKTSLFNQWVNQKIRQKLTHNKLGSK